MNQKTFAILPLLLHSIIGLSQKSKHTTDDLYLKKTEKSVIVGESYHINRINDGKVIIHHPTRKAKDISFSCGCLKGGCKVIIEPEGKGRTKITCDSGGCESGCDIFITLLQRISGICMWIETTESKKKSTISVTQQKIPSSFTNCFHL